MPEPIIKVTDLSKSYIINHEGSERYTALRDVVTNKAKKLFSFPKNLSTTQQLNNSTKEEFWALKDLNFEILQGDRVGIIGRNGAGKSTLLKILSRITEPTKGRIELNGRVASLLEVGTGFHPELTGRENIYLNGAILGMSRAEIKRKFDEIVDFAEVERFLDTPVKRYSSGMYVRLAFAVAAHLEPEILIVDEVLAVGDAQFQKKCLGKMEDVSKNEGRTVLFVSHNMSAIQALTNKGLLLSNGRISYSGEVTKCIKKYNEFINVRTNQIEIKGTGKHSAILSFSMIGENGEIISNYLPGTIMHFRCKIKTDGTPNLSFEIFIYDNVSQLKIGMFSLFQFLGQKLPAKDGESDLLLDLNGIHLASGEYRLDIKTSVINDSWDHEADNALVFQVPFSSIGDSTYDYKSSYDYGNIALVPNKTKFL